MSAVLKPSPITSGIELPDHAAVADLIDEAAQDFLAGLHRRFEPARQARLVARCERQAMFDAGALPDFRADTRAIREGDWRVAPIPAALPDRRGAITGPVDPTMVINALNSGASRYTADCEARPAPTSDPLP